jgi:hypothetical protein
MLRPIGACTQSRRAGQHIMIVGHGATLWMLTHWLQEQPLEAVVGVFPERLWRFILRPAALA